MSQNSFIKQYLAKQQELLRQRLERQAREAYETNGKCDSDHLVRITVKVTVLALGHCAEYVI